MEADVPGIYYNGTAEMNIELKQMPVLVMRPISTVVAETESVDINCHIRNVEEAYFDSNDTMLKLCFANGTEIHRFTGDMYTQSYRFDGRFSENFTCGLGNCTQFGVSSRITVTGKGKERSHMNSVLLNNKIKID